MTDIEIVRRFNRTVTRTIGALNGNYLGRNRPLAASRLLYEIGGRGAEIRTLRERLGLDSGYLSRLLRALEKEGLLRVTAGRERRQGGTDHRVRHAAITAKGRKEIALLDALSDRAADGLLASVPRERHAALIEAMRTVERVLDASAIEVAPADVRGAAAQGALRAYFAELAARFEGGFDPGAHATGNELAPPDGVFLLATLYGEPVGCGGLALHEGYAEIKRMWVDPRHRGTGTGTRILRRLEEESARLGRDVVRLDTNRVLLEAHAMYAREGYRRIDRYNDNPYASFWYEKRLQKKADPGGTVPPA